MNKSTKNTTATKKATSKNATSTKGMLNTNRSTCPHSYVRVCKNIYKVNGTGAYRVRTTINGMSYSKNFRLLREAKAYLKSL
jgi:hypothetical protein